MRKPSRPTLLSVLADLASVFGFPIGVVSLLIGVVGLLIAVATMRLPDDAGKGDTVTGTGEVAVTGEGAIREAPIKISGTGTVGDAADLPAE